MIFPEELTLSGHDLKRTPHGTESRPIYQCSTCQRSFEFRSQLPSSLPPCKGGLDPWGNQMPVTEMICVHRGRVTGERVCKLCGLRGTKIQVFACTLHGGECTWRMWEHNQKERTCVTCKEFREKAVEPQDVGDLRIFFERVYIINLKRRPDRLKEFRQRMEIAQWPFAEPIVYPAVEGDVVGVPAEFTQGGGAYGCRMSHLRILQDCLMEGVSSVLILEDDADLQPGFAEEVKQFLSSVPSDWEGIMLGGQHHKPPFPVSPGVVRVTYAQRTHAYAARPSYMRALQERWGNGTVHIDWMMQGWQYKRLVYAPARWLIGQGGGRSDIRGAPKLPEWWNPPTGDEPVILLHAPRAVVEDLRKRGWHFGYTIDKTTGVDVGLPQCFDPNVSEPRRRSALLRWIDMIQEECLSNHSVCAVWYPDATVEMIREVWHGPVREISATTTPEADAQVPAKWRKHSRSRDV